MRTHRPREVLVAQPGDEFPQALALGAITGQYCIIDWHDNLLGMTGFRPLGVILQ
jgi:hypothetical protein